MIEQITQYFVTAYEINPLWQMIGIIAFLLSVINFAYWKDKSFIVWMMIASFFWWIHFLLIWALSAWYVQLFDVVKNAFWLKFEKNNYLASLFIISYLIIWALNYSSFISIIPIFCAVLWVILTFYIRWIWLNIWYLFVISLWFIYNFYAWSIWWLSSDIVLFFAWIYWIYKIFHSNKKWKK